MVFAFDGKLFSILVFSVTAVLGYQPQDMLGKSVYEFYHPDDQLQMKETFEQGIHNT